MTDQERKDQAIDTVLLIREVERAVDRNDTSKPDSLGDKLFRICLNLKFAHRTGGNKLPADLVNTANRLLNQCNA